MISQLHHNCLICSSSSLKNLEKYNHAHLVECTNCGFIFSKRIPSDVELISNYNNYNRERAISPLTIKRYNEILDVFEFYRKNNTIIDIGCGEGHFLEIANKRGWLIYGTEFRDEAINICSDKGIKMQKGSLNAAHYKNIEFDIACAFEVIEHINNPIEEIKNINLVLRTGGAFYFTTPNFNSISRYFLNKKWSIIEYPEHLCYYTSKTIHYLLTKNSFKKIQLLTTGISLSRINKALDKKILHTSTSVNADEVLRNKIEENKLLLFIKKSVNYLLISFKKGDSLKGLYKKR